MTVSPVSSSGAAATTAPPSTATSLSAVDSSTFLKLLVAQLKYQDPMNPAQGTEFLAQTAQFTMVEKLNALAQQSSDALASSRVVEATQMLGCTVSYTDSTGTTVSGVVSGTKLLASGPVLEVGGTDVALSAVLSVKSPVATPSTVNVPAPPAAGTSGSTTA
jgi:flagellar basal-body rod modification protein FlgD